MTNKNIIIGFIVVMVLVGVGYYFFRATPAQDTTLDPTPQNVTLTGSYACLPYLDTTQPQTEECAFGLKTDDGVYYAVNFGQAENSMNLFQTGARITAEGFTVIKEALSTDHWAKYNMKGIFTITKMINPLPAQGKFSMNVICDSALAYMTFPDSKATDTFIAECRDGKHPEVVERFKKDMGFGDGMAI